MYQQAAQEGGPGTHGRCQKGGGVGKLWFDVFRAGVGREEKAFIGEQGSYRSE